MEIFPAIDIKDGKVVRLTQGDYGRVEVYSENPVEIAAAFAAKGAKNLHVVDLDGARDGALSNFEIIKSIALKTDLFIEVGGGIRDESRVKKYLDVGVGRVIIGTAAITDFDFLIKMLAAHSEKIAVGVDARDEKIAVNGWTKTTETNSVAFCEKLADSGVATIIYTDISKDGAMAGTNMDIYKRLQSKIKCDFIASGGISSLIELKQLRAVGLYGAIVGKALYQGALTLEEVLKV